MRKFFIISFLSFNIFAFRIYPGGGLFTLEDTDENQSFNSKTLFGSAAGISFDLGVETATFLNFSIIGNIGIDFGQATVQYNYTDGQGDQYTLDDYDAVLRNFYGSMGLRFYLLDYSILKFYVGGGMMYGALTLQYDENQYAENKGSTLGYQDVDSASYGNIYYEAGLMFLWSKKNGLSFEYKIANLETDKFKTLGEVGVDSSHSQYLIKYIHVVDFSFFWK